jgi:hypothetical protein
VVTAGILTVVVFLPFKAYLAVQAVAVLHQTQTDKVVVALAFRVKVTLVVLAMPQQKAMAVKAQVVVQAG